MKPKPHDTAVKPPKGPSHDQFEDLPDRGQSQHAAAGSATVADLERGHLKVPQPARYTGVSRSHIDDELARGDDERPGFVNRHGYSSER